MKRILRWIGLCLIAFVVLIAATFSAYRLRGPSSAQREAATLLQRDYRPKQGVNAFPLLWFMRYDVPEDQLGARMAADVEKVREQLAMNPDTPTYAPSARELPEPRHNDSNLCGLRASNCLARVTAAPTSVREALSMYEGMAQKVRMLEGADYLWNEFPTDARSPVGLRTSPQTLWLSELALQYAQGDHMAAIAGTCRNIETWRRLRRSTNSLIADMLAIAFAEDAMHLLADMLARQSGMDALPADCASAMRSIESADLDRCSVMAGEFANATSEFRRVAPRKQTWTGPAFYWLIIDQTTTAATYAERFAPYCEKATTDAMLEDSNPDFAYLAFTSYRPECLANIAGCMVLALPTPVFADYDRRTLDFAAHLRLTATLLWMREQPGGTLSERFERRPGSQRSAKHAGGVDQSRGTLYVDNFYTTREARFELPFESAKAGVVAAASDSMRQQQ